MDTVIINHTLPNSIKLGLNNIVYFILTHKDKVYLVFGKLVKKGINFINGGINFHLQNIGFFGGEVYYPKDCDCYKCCYVSENFDEILHQYKELCSWCAIREERG